MFEFDLDRAPRWQDKWFRRTDVSDRFLCTFANQLLCLSGMEVQSRKCRETFFDDDPHNVIADVGARLCDGFHVTGNQHDWDTEVTGNDGIDAELTSGLSIDS